MSVPRNYADFIIWILRELFRFLTTLAIVKSAPLSPIRLHSGKAAGMGSVRPLFDDEELMSQIGT